MHRARKRFGQHFLHDRNIIDRILRAIAPQAGDNILEIGPGQGALTYPLLQRCDRLTAIELDRDLVPVLEQRAPAFGQLEVINADILEFELSSIASTRKFRLVGNLPYNISTPLMFHLLESADLIEDMHFMVQKEVAQRIVAVPGDSSYGRLSVMLQCRCLCQYLFDVAPTCFRPPPKVDSAVIRLLPLERPKYAIGDAASFARIVQTAFSQRRKTISNSLKSLLDRETIIACGIDPGLRAENLEIADFAKLSRALTQ
ncbi:MAG: 16S rRNA (adenine(1518)-N(6)/adenine(1519)-N(6))-dimethyltransferase RsmA [Gammaproteobacteria bacterium]|jgi:16S rRNA (adenine1518-N6/adenine1519-N6)-dimethyltransferase|nr:16S rRNA (adenine(1518)-N(6)/adenine(1519)-N(6))-dimethyltransferase RsmA [Gammaproteobacteria bacterium]